MTNNKIHKFKFSLLNDTFLSEIKVKSIRNELKAVILEGYTKRVELKLSQQQWSQITGVPLPTIKRIEKGKCYNPILISNYLNQ